MRIGYKKFQFKLPTKTDLATRSFLKRNKFVSRAITHTASDLPEKSKREELWKAFKEEYHQFVKVCTYLYYISEALLAVY